jgi:hypothetical protein
VRLSRCLDLKAFECRVDLDGDFSQQVVASFQPQQQVADFGWRAAFPEPPFELEEKSNLIL